MSIPDHHTRAVQRSIFSARYEEFLQAANRARSCAVPGDREAAGAGGFSILQGVPYFVRKTMTRSCSSLDEWKFEGLLTRHVGVNARGPFQKAVTYVYAPGSLFEVLMADYMSNSRTIYPPMEPSEGVVHAVEGASDDLGSARAIQLLNMTNNDLLESW